MSYQWQHQRHGFHRSGMRSWWTGSSRSKDGSFRFSRWRTRNLLPAFVLTVRMALIGCLFVVRCSKHSIPPLRFGSPFVALFLVNSENGRNSVSPTFFLSLSLSLRRISKCVRGRTDFHQRKRTESLPTANSSGLAVDAVECGGANGTTYNKCIEAAKMPPKESEQKRNRLKDTVFIRDCDRCAAATTASRMSAARRRDGRGRKIRNLWRDKNKILI